MSDTTTFEIEFLSFEEVVTVNIIIAFLLDIKGK